MDGDLRPPLVKRIGPRGWAALDWCAAVVLMVVMWGLLKDVLDSPAGRYLPAGHGVDWPRLVPAAVIVAPVALRRRWPLQILALLLAESLALLAMQAPTWYPILPGAFVNYLIAATLPRRPACIALAVTLSLLAAETLSAALWYRLNVAASVIAGLIVVIGWIIGYAVGQHRAYSAAMREVAITDERLRIARELHDVVAHSMSVIALQAGVGHHVIDSQPDDARAALHAIETTSRETMVGLRRMLGMLRRAEAGAGPPEIAPGLADLDLLAASTARAGVQVDVRRCGRPRRLPVDLDLAAYRIVQEALANVVKHARTGTCQVSIDYDVDELRIEIIDHGRGHGGGGGYIDSDRRYGITGMRERTALFRGHLYVGPLPGRGFRVVARLPLTGVAG